VKQNKGLHIDPIYSQAKVLQKLFKENRGYDIRYVEVTQKISDLERIYGKARKQSHEKN
jgi:type IV secretory pathway TraG/TraD family ATPase VirD4